MENDWKNCKKILCIRPDNMGDILMSTPAINALKTTFNCHITLLTSSMGKPITPFIPIIDEVITFDFPWVKNNISNYNNQIFVDIVEKIKMLEFDAAVIFTVYSQNPLPTVMLAYLAGIPLRLSYCRENPYGLLSNWVPDKEPYTYILHQVKRDLALVETVGAIIQNDHLLLSVANNKWQQLQIKLSELGVDVNKNWLIAHAGVSEEKRAYPNGNWIKLTKQIITGLNYQVLFTGAASEASLTEELANDAGFSAISLGGKLSMEEFILLISKTPLVISVNTVTIHIAAATNTPIVVLYAFTNPQHFSWKAKGKVLSYQVSQNLKSKNEVIQFVTDNLHPDIPKMQMPDDVFMEVSEILVLNKIDTIEEMPLLKRNNLKN